MLTKGKPQLFDSEQTVDVYLTKRFINQVQYLVAKQPSLEWSGMLLYTVLGDINKPDKMKITLQYIYLMDIGSGAATEYETDQSFVEFRMNNPDMLKCRIGHIHSHNTMQTFFSGTDNDELIENSEFHNYYLSVIVNTKLDITGKIAFRAVPQKMIARNSYGKPYQLIMQAPYVIAYKCNFKLNMLADVSEQFDLRYKEVDKKTEQKKQTYSQGTWDGQKWISNSQPQFPIPAYGKNEPKIEDDLTREDYMEGLEDFICLNFCKDDDFSDDPELDNFYNDLFTCGTVSDLLKELEILRLEGNEKLFSTVIENAVSELYADAYDQYGATVDIDMLIDLYINRLRVYMTDYPSIVKDIIVKVNEYKDYLTKSKSHVKV